MTFAFKALSVNCSSALGGEILQVWFDSLAGSKDEGERDRPCVIIGRNFEFPGSATIEWHDGSGYHGGANIVLFTLTRERAMIMLDRDLAIDVSFTIDDRRFAQLSSQLRRILDEDIFATT